MKYAPLARIVLRYLSGVSFGGAALASWLGVDPEAFLDPDLVMIVATSIGAMIEGIYILAKKRGWAT